MVCFIFVSNFAFLLNGCLPDEGRMMNRIIVGIFRLISLVLLFGSASCLRLTVIFWSLSWMLRSRSENVQFFPKTTAFLVLVWSVSGTAAGVDFDT
jgi:hypothetical protein